MADFSGIEDFVGAVTGRGRLDDAAYNASLTRLTRQRAAQTSLDKQLELLAREKDINANRGAAGGLIPDDLLRSLTLGNLGSSFSGAQSGTQTGIENEALQAALDAVLGAQAGGTEQPTDFVNALTGVRAGKLLSPTNVQVQDQATSDIGASDALGALNRGKRTDLLPVQVEAQQALTGARNASALRSERPSASGRLNLENPSIDLLGLLGNVETEVESENPLLRFLGEGKTTETTEDLLPAFLQFQSENALLDPNYQDASFAVNEFLKSRSANNAPVAGAGPGPELGVPGTAVAALQADPTLAAEFDAKYGEGAAARYLQ